MHPTSPRPRDAAAALALALVAGLGTAGCSAPPGDVTSGTRVSTGAAASPEATSSASPPALPTFDPATTVGDYATGFPVDLLAAPDDTTVLASSATPRDADMVEVSLNLSTSLRVEEVVARYAERLDAAGFEESDPDDLAASDLAAFSAYTRTRGKKTPRLESVHLGVVDEGDERLVTVSGVVRAPDET